MTFPFLLRRRVAVEDRFWFPLPIAARTALVDTGFCPGPNTRAFAVDDLDLMVAWLPAALALPLGLALWLADQKRRGLVDLPSLNTAIIVLTSIDDSPLADHHRDILWSAFHVPIFEQLRGSDGTVIARECEVHDGLHIVGSLPHIEGELIRDHCACGSETPRLRRSTSARERSAVA